MKRCLYLLLRTFAWIRIVYVLIIIITAFLISKHIWGYPSNDINTTWSMYHSGLMLRIVFMLPYLYLISEIGRISTFSRIVLIHMRRRLFWFFSQVFILFTITILYFTLYEACFLGITGMLSLSHYPLNELVLLYCWVLAYGLLFICFGIFNQGNVVMQAIILIIYNFDISMQNSMQTFAIYAPLSFTGKSIKYLLVEEWPLVICSVYWLCVFIFLLTISCFNIQHTSLSQRKEVWD